VAFSFGEILNFLRPMQFFFVNKKMIPSVCQISEKAHISLIIQIQTSGFAVGRFNHTPLAW
jgi:hypothetical protein